MSTQDKPDLTPLADRYDIEAELFEREDARSFLANRRADGARVLILVARGPNGDERNALTHFASDVNLLTGVAHRNLVPVVEGQWLGAGAFAVVSERVAGQRLEELRAREEFSNERIARILQDVNGLLEWARAQGIVHRGVSWSTIYLEPGSDRVLASFEIRPIPVTGVPGAEGDARTIAALAWTLLTGRPSGAERLTESTDETAGALPKRLVDRTEALLRAERDRDEDLDIRGYIAMIAMADILAEGDAEAERLQATLESEQRSAREQLAQERAEFEHTIAEREQRFSEDRDQLEQTVAAQREELAAERQNLLRAIAEEREALEKERRELQTAIAAERARLEEDRRLVEQRRVEARQYLEEIELRRRELELLGEDIAQFGEEQRVLDEPPPHEPLAENAEPAIESFPTPAATPVSGNEAEPASDVRAYSAAAPTSEMQAYPPVGVDSTRRRARWIAPAAALGLLGVVAVSAVAFRGDDDERSSSRSSAVVRTIDSASGGMAPAPSAAETATVSRPDSAVDSAAVTPPPRPRRRPVAAAVDSTTRSADTISASQPTQSTRRDTRDTLARAESALVRRDTSFAGRDTARSTLDSIAAPVIRLPALTDSSVTRTTIPRRDSVARRDSVRRDTVVRRDSVPRPRPDTIP